MATHHSGNNKLNMTVNIQNLRKEYSFHPLLEEEVKPDPLLQFEDWFTDAVNAKVDEPNAMVLSTAGAGGRVSARVVLLKGLENGGFLFFSNYTSRKGLQLDLNPNAALTFLWREIGRQVRVEGRVRKISRAASKTYFNSRPAESRISALISPQSSTIPDRAFLEALRDGAILDLGKNDPDCPADWGGYLVKPFLVEFWQGREYRLHDRIQYLLNGKTWTIERLAP